jgi:hypothetical protein
MALHYVSRTLVVCAIALSAVAAVAAPPTLGKNLIQNPGAEAGAGATSSSQIVAPPRWTAVGNITAVVYGAPGFPNASTPGPEKRGVNFFAGGPTNAQSSIEQRINVGALADQINTGTIGYGFSGYFGGNSTENDNVGVTITFAAFDGTVLGTDELPAVLADDRGNVTSLVRRKINGLVPVNTHFILVTVTFTRVSFVYNNSYADALSLVLKESQ